MNQASIIQHISDAKQAHISWIKRARHLVEGLPVNKEFIPLKTTSCRFGKWLYSDGIFLCQLESSNKLFKELELKHNELHETYKNIYKIFFIIPSQKSLIQKIFSFNHYKISANEQEKAEIYFKYLKRTSNELIAILVQLEKEIQILSYQDLKKLKLSD